MGSPRAHVEQIRRVRFNVGGTPNPLSDSLHQAIIHLSAELYQKDVHFFSELIQNAEDNAYPRGIEPTLELVLTREDVAEVGASATLLLFNNEQGFESRHVSALCAVGNSTKKEQRNEGYIGEKGIGFKSVFMVTSTPYVISNGYRIRFSDTATSTAELAFIVPEWVDRPTDERLRRFCQGKILPKTTLVLPLRVDKVAAIQKELKQLSPETIMFLKRISRLRIRDETGSNSVELDISRSNLPRLEVANGFISSMNLSVTKVPGKISEECKYYVSEQSFPVTATVEQRKEVKKWIITLVFPYFNRPSAHQSTGDVFAFLPSQLKSGFPFIINSDFLLVSSRETLRFDSPWNLGILECVPTAFLNVFKMLLDGKESTCATLNVQHIYKYIPVAPNRQPEFDRVRNTILTSLKEEKVLLVDARLRQVPSRVGNIFGKVLRYADLGQTPSGGERIFCKPALGRQITRKFRNILHKAYGEKALSSTVTQSSWNIVDEVVQNHYPDALKELGVPFMSWSEYLSIIDSQWIMMLSEDLYLQVVEFVAIDIPILSEASQNATLAIEQLPFLKYHEEGGSCSLATIREVIKEKKVRIYILPLQQEKWLSEWICRFKPWITIYFLPPKTAIAVGKLKRPQHTRLITWLTQCASISELSVESYAEQLMDGLEGSRDLEFLLLVTKFLQSSVSEMRFDLEFVADKIHQLARISIVDESGQIVRIGRQSDLTTLLPRHGSKWPILLGDNTWSCYFVRLSDDYLLHYLTQQPLDPEDAEVFKSFLSVVFRAKDLPELVPPNAPLPASVLSDHMTQKQSICLLQWLAYLKERRSGWPKDFESSIKTTAWVKTERHGACCPEVCFLPTKELTTFFRPGDVPFLDKSFYGHENYSTFQYVLKDLGVIIKPDASGSCDAVAEILRSMASASEMTDPEQAIRLYRFLQKFQWRTDRKDMLIFIPRPVGWKSPKDCVIEDKHKIFKDVLPILEDIYPKDLLPFFREILKVPRKPVVDDYCRLWLSWTINLSDRNKEQIGVIWRKIAKQWGSCTPEVKQAFKTGASMPTTKVTGGQEFQLVFPGYTFIPDDLDLQHLFVTNCDTADFLSFVWYPKGPGRFQSQLNKVYSDLGVRLLSDCIETEFRFSASSERNLQPGEGLVSHGLFTAILGFLSDQNLACELLAPEKQDMLKPLRDSIEVEIDSPFERRYNLKSPSNPGRLLTVKRNAMAYWDKKNHKIFRLSKDHVLLQAPLTLREFETQFAETIVSGILSEHPAICPSMVEYLRLMIGSGFQESVVEYELRRRNLKIYEEDIEFLQQ